jgi:hypothetical protein
MARILLLFVDGIGLAPAGDTNPLSTVETPAIRALLGGPLTLEQVQQRDGLVLVPLDATLGVPGLPQSGTGQTALFTGENGAAILGHHVPAFPGPTLRKLIAERSIFKQVVEAGRRAVFANPLPDSFVAAVESGERRGSVTTWAAIAGGKSVMRDLDDLRAGRAVAWDVSGDHFAARAGHEVGFTPPSAAGRNLAAIAGDADLTVWETFLTDLAAHGRWGLQVEDAVARLDGLLGGLLAARPVDLTVLVTSDHGNLEDSTHRVHTRNSVPLLAVGPSATAFARLTSLLEVTSAILEGLAITRSN